MIDHDHIASAKAFEPTDGYRTLRETCPVLHVADHDPPFYVVSRFDDVTATVRRPDVFVNRFGPGVFFQDAGALGTTDDPDHARHRSILKAAFLPSAIARLESRITEMSSALLDDFLPRGEGDYVEHVAGPLPALAIAELLGVPADERDNFRHWSEDAVAALSDGDIESYGRAKRLLEDTVERGVNIRLESPGDDVLTLLARALTDGTIDRTEARHIGYQLLVAGHETTTSLLGTLVYRLLERPPVMQQLRDDPDLIPAAVEEGLRFDSPVHGLFRTTVDDVEVAGTPIPAGCKVQVAFASANRDPEVFADPDEFRLDRAKHEIGRHVAFGWGVHHCLGAPLARLTTRIALRQLLDRTTSIGLAGTPERNDSFVLHGLTHLPLTWTVS